MTRALAWRVALSVSLGLGAFIVWTCLTPVGPPPPRPLPVLDPVECGRLLTAVIEGALRKHETLQVDPPPGCVSATFPPPYAAASYPTGTVLLRDNEIVARFAPRATPTPARRGEP